MILDSGERREFVTGAVRDISEEKGRCDLLPLEEVAWILEDDILSYIDSFVRTREKECIKMALLRFQEERYLSGEEMMLEVAKHYAEGCRKYQPRNWEKGIPLSSFVDSSVRHYLKFQHGYREEPHDRAFVWNLLGLLWTLNNHPDMDDLPYNDVINIESEE